MSKKQNILVITNKRLNKLLPKEVGSKQFIQMMNHQTFRSLQILVKILDL